MSLSHTFPLLSIIQLPVWTRLLKPFRLHFVLSSACACVLCHRDHFQHNSEHLFTPLPITWLGHPSWSNLIARFLQMFFFGGAYLRQNYICKHSCASERSPARERSPHWNICQDVFLCDTHPNYELEIIWEHPTPAAAAPPLHPARHTRSVCWWLSGEASNSCTLLLSEQLSPDTAPRQGCEMLLWLRGSKSNWFFRSG